MIAIFAKKLFRDFCEHWTQFISVFLMTGLSVLIFSGLEGGWRGIDQELTSFAEEHHLPDAWVHGFGLSINDVNALDDLAGVDDVDLVLNLSVIREDSGHNQELLLTSQSQGGLNTPFVAAGKKFSDHSGVWLDRSYANKNDLDVGDSITVVIAGRSQRLTIQGLILQPDKMAYTAPGLVAPEPEKFGYGRVSEETMRTLSGPSGPASGTLLIRGEQEGLSDAARTILGDRYLSYQDRQSNPAVATVYERVGQIQSLSYLFSALFLLVALLAIFTSIRRLTDIQRGEIATLKALGMSDLKIAGYYTAAGLAAVLAGCGAGLFLTPLLSRYVLTTQQGSFSLPHWTPAYSWASAVLPLVLIVICVVASWSATSSMRKTTPAAGLRPSMGRVRRISFERFNPLWERLTFGSRWAIRDGRSNPVRVGMGVVAATGCMMLLLTGFGMPDTLNEQVHQSFSEQYRYDTRVGLSPLATAEQRDQLQERAGAGQWLEQRPARINDHGQERTLTILGQGELFLPLSSDGQPVSPPATGALISDRLAKELKVEPGDYVRVDVAGEAERSVKIAGRAAISEPQGVLMSEQAWRQLDGTFTPNAYLTADPVSSDISDLPYVSQTVGRAQQQANAQMLVDSLTSVFTLIKIFAILLAVIVLYNLGSLSFTERIRDYATLRVLGFHHGEIRGLASRENIATTVLGWLLGIPAGWWFLSQYVSLFSTDRADYAPAISLISLVAASLITLVFALTATLLLTSRIKKVDMTGALKGVE